MWRACVLVLAAGALWFAVQAANSSDEAACLSERIASGQPAVTAGGTGFDFDEGVQWSDKPAKPIPLNQVSTAGC